MGCREGRLSGGGLRWVRVYFIRLNGSTECEQYKNADPGVASLSVSGGDKNSGLVKSQVIAWYVVCRFSRHVEKDM